jgi:hypothetical protein
MINGNFYISLMTLVLSTILNYLKLVEKRLFAIDKLL